MFPLGFLRKPNTGNNCGGREDKLMSRTLETNGLAEKFNWDARYKFPLNKKQWTRVSGCCNDLPLRKNTRQNFIYLNSAFDN